MKMNKKGFTLIELLAVIVILAIIALIVTPVISNIITSAKQAANARSVEGYAKDIQYAIITAAFENGSVDMSAYNVASPGSTTLPTGVNPDASTRVTNCTYIIEDGTVKKMTGCKVDNSTETYKYEEGKGATVESGS